MQIIRDIAYAKTDNPQQMLDLYLPDAENFSTFVYFHGGGIESGSKNEDDADLSALTDRNIAVANVNYRLYPSAHFPDFIRDCAAALFWVTEHINLYGHCKNIYVGGSSAGGYIAMMLYFDRRFLETFHLSLHDFSGFIFDAGQPTTHFNVLKERGIDPRRVVIDEAAPIFHVADYNSEPPVLMIVSDHDMENRLEQTQLLLSTMKCFGYPKETVVFQLMKNSSHCSYLGQPVFVNMIADFIEYKFKKE